MRPRRVPVRQVFVDSSAYFALTDPRDSNHRMAAELARQFAVQRWTLVTSNFIRAETHALLLNRLGRDSAMRFLDTLERGRTSLARVTETDEERAHSILRQYDDKDFSFTDATSFAVMRRLRITVAFTFDHRFEQFGLTPATREAFR